MSGWPDSEALEERSGDDLGRSVGKGIEVRWALLEDEIRIAELLELNGIPRWVAFEERFVVAERKGKVLAALRCRTASKRLVLGLLIADPLAEERPLVAALYAEALELAREIGVAEVLVRLVPYENCLSEASHRRRARRQWLNATCSLKSRGQLPASGWRRAVALLGVLAIPFHRAFRD